MIPSICNLRSVLRALAFVGFCLATVFAMSPRSALAQSNVLVFEHEFGKLDGYFHKPHGVAVDGQGYIYVTDFDDHRVQVFDAAGNFVRKWGYFGNDPGEFIQPMGITVDDWANRVYVTEMGNERIQVFDKNGTFLTVFGSAGSAPGQLFDAHDIAIGGKGLYVADTWNHRIQIFDKTGGVAHLWGGQGSGPGQFDTPKAIAFYQGLVYVADSGNDRVQVFDEAGAFLRSFGAAGTGNGQFDTPSGIAVDANGILVTDSVNHRIQRFDFAGTWKETLGASGSAPGQLNVPMGIATGADPNRIDLFVVDSHNHRVQRLDKRGNAVQILGSATAPDGHLTQPKGIAYDAKSEVLYVADFGNDRIQVFDVSGQFLYGWPVAAQPVDVAIDPTDRHVWVVSLIGQVERYDSNGSMLASWSVPSGPGPGFLGTPSGIAVDALQNVYISNQWAFSGSGSNTDGRIHVAGASGNFLATWGVTGISQGYPLAIDTFDMPADLQLDALGKSLFVAVDGQNRIKQVGIEANMSMGGVLEFSTGSYRPHALALRPDGSLFAADTVGRLWYFDEFNRLAYQQDRVVGGGAGEFRNISDMEYAPETKHHAGLIVISEWENNRIQVFTLNGL